MSVRIRLTGTPGDVAAVREVLVEVLDVLEVSGFRPNRGQSVLGRVYPEAAGPTDTAPAVPPTGTPPAPRPTTRPRTLRTAGRPQPSLAR